MFFNRFWCKLSDSCLHCFHKPHSDVTRHKTMLRGYNVIADVINLHKTRFAFRLEMKV